jgi:hypothetical protein
MTHWLTRLFPEMSSVGGHFGELLSVNLFFNPELRERIEAVVCVAELFARYHIASVEVVGALPNLCATLAAEARRRHIPVLGDVKRSALARLPLAIAALARELARGLLDHRRLRALKQRLAAIPTSGEAPVLWIAISGRWRPTARHVVENVALRCEAANLPYGLVFVHDIGGPRDTADGVYDELAWFDGTLGRLHPARIAQANLPNGLIDEVRTLAHLLCTAAPALVRCARHAGTFRVGGAIASLPDDFPALVRTATLALRRTLEAELGTQQFLEEIPRPNLVVFGCPIFGEVQIFDRLVQATGAITVDYAHGTACETDTATHWRSASTLHASWTRVEAERFTLEGVHQECRGGYMPALAANATHAVEGVPIVLALTSYLHPFYNGDMRILGRKHARRFAAAITELARALEGEARVVLRPHPAEDRAEWQALLGEAPVDLSREIVLSADLARARVVVSIKTSAVIEALAAGLPVLLHRGFAVEPTSFFGYFPEERWFSSGGELTDKTRTLLEQGAGAPERRVLEACFGSDHRPVRLWDWIEELITVDWHAAETHRLALWPNAR